MPTSAREFKINKFSSLFHNGQLKVDFVSYVLIRKTCKINKLLVTKEDFTVL